VWALGVILYTLVVGFRPFQQGDYISLDEVAQSPDGVDTTPGSSPPPVGSEESESESDPRVSFFYCSFFFRSFGSAFFAFVLCSSFLFLCLQSSGICCSKSSRGTRVSAFRSTASWHTLGPAFDAFRTQHTASHGEERERNDERCILLIVAVSNIFMMYKAHITLYSIVCAGGLSLLTRLSRAWHRGEERRRRRWW